VDPLQSRHRGDDLCEGGAGDARGDEGDVGVVFVEEFEVQVLDGSAGLEEGGARGEVFGGDVFDRGVVGVVGEGEG